MSEKEEKLTNCIKNLISNLEEILICGFPPPGASLKISKDISDAKELLKKGK